MEFTRDQQYLHYSSSGFIYHFYMMNKNIYVKTIKNNQIQSNIKIVNDIIDYSVDVDDFDIFHLVSISVLGDLQYYIYKNNQWHHKSLTKYDGNSFRFKNLNLFIINNNIHILLAISNIINTELWTLKHHYWNNQKWIINKVCDIVTEKYDLPFYADKDPYDNLHIVFKSLTNKNYQIYYCKYNITYNLWSIPIKISKISRGNSHPFILCDSVGGAHIAWSGFYNNHLTIFYLYNNKINSSKNYWSDIKRLSNEGTNSIYPFIFQVENNIKIVWKQSDQYFLKNINLSSNIQTETLESQPHYDHTLYPISIIGDTYKSLKSTKIPYTYGSLNNDEFFIVGLDQFMPKEDVEFMIDTTSSTNKHTLIEEEPSNGNTFLNKTEIASEENKILEVNKDPNKNQINERLNIHLKLTELIEAIHIIQLKQKNTHELLKNLNDQQKLYECKIDEIINLCSTMNKDIHIPNKGIFMKIKNLFK